MSKNIAIQFDHVGKLYHLGVVGTGTLSHDLNRWWQTRILHHEDPYLKIGETNDRASRGSSDFVWALQDITFDVMEGDVVGIIGKNGAGKSTLLKLLSRVTSPTTGAIRARGRIASLLEVGTGFHPEMTGRENIYMNGSIMGMTRHEITRKLDEIVDFAGVERYLDTPVKRYSSGMTVRLGFAVAAFLEPEILVVDEVLAVGDAEFQKKAIGKMQDVSRGEGRTVLFVSHNMAAVKSLCTRGVVLENGKIVFQGTQDEAVDHYLKEDEKLLAGSKIIEHITEKVPFIDITDISINGFRMSEFTILSEQNYIDISICGTTKLEVNVCLAVQFANANDVKIATYCYGIYKGEKLALPVGTFKIQRRIQLPKYIGSGETYLHISLFEPRIQTLVTFSKCAKIYFQGYSDPYCRPVKINSEGFLGLE